MISFIKHDTFNILALEYIVTSVFNTSDFIIDQVNGFYTLY